MRDPFEILMDLKGSGQLNTDFTRELGNVAYHAPCHIEFKTLATRPKKSSNLCTIQT